MLEVQSRNRSYCSFSSGAKCHLFNVDVARSFFRFHLSIKLIIILPRQYEIASKTSKNVSSHCPNLCANI